MTHSFLYFSVLPIMHFVYLKREHLAFNKQNGKYLCQLTVLLGAPIFYYVLRSMYWPPDAEYLWYHTIYLRAVLVGLVYFLPFVVSAIGLFLRVRSGKGISSKVLIITLGFLAFAVGVFPYLSSGNLDSRMTFFFWELDWTSRHQLLMPLGASAITIAIIYFVLEKQSKHVLALVLVAMISLNVYWGVGTYVDSLKKDALEDLLSVELAGDNSLSFVFVDKSRQFNFRESAYRWYEFAGLLSDAGRVPVPAVKYECGEGSNQTQVVISSDKGLFEAFFSQDLGLRLDIWPCESS